MRQTIYLSLALVCSLLLCFFSPLYFTSAEDAGHYFSMRGFAVEAMHYVDGSLVADDAFTYATTDETGATLSTTTGSSIMNIWALPVLAIAMALLCLVDIILGVRAVKLKDLLHQINLNIATLVCAVGYYAMVILYAFFVVKNFDLDWHLSWAICLPIILFILVIMAMQTISKSAKKLRRDLSGSIR